MIGDSPELICRCLDDVRAGRITADECFSRYPEAAAELAGLLQVARAIAPAPRVEPDPAFRVRARSTMLNAIAAERAQKKSPLRRLWTFLVGDPTPVARRAEMPVSVFLALSILVGGGSAGVAIAATDSLPGQAIYPIKSFGEIVQVTLAPSDDYRTALHLTYASRRLDEMERLKPDTQMALIEQTAKRYNNHLDEALRLSANRPTSGNVAELVQRIGKREQVLAQLRSNAPAPSAPELAVAVALTNIVEERTANPVPQAGAVPAPVAAPHPEYAVPASANAKAVAAAANDMRRQSSMIEPTVVELAAGVANAYPSQELVASITDVGNAMRDGKPEAAVAHLHAFAGKLNGMQQSGSISQNDYDNLYNAYADAARRLGATAVPTVARGKAAKPTSNPTAGQPAATPRAGGPTTTQPEATTQVTAPAASTPQATPEPVRTPPGKGTPGAPSSDNK